MMNDQDSREFERAANAMLPERMFFSYLKFKEDSLCSAIVFARDVKNNKDRERVTQKVQNNNKLCKVILRE